MYENQVALLYKLTRAYKALPALLLMSMPSALAIKPLKDKKEARIKRKTSVLAETIEVKLKFI